MNRDRDALRTMIHEMGFASVEDHLMRYARPSIRVYTERVEDEAVIPLGASKIGGRPDLPSQMAWGRVLFKDQQVEMPFIAQIRLSDVKTCDEEDWLPDRGMLYFFADIERPAIPDQGRVVYFDGDFSTLERKPFPSSLMNTEIGEYYDRFFPCALTFVPEVNLSFEVTDTDIPYPDRKTWEDLYDLIYTTNYTRPPYVTHTFAVNRLLGVEYDVPEDLQLDCQLIADTGYPYNPTNAQRQHAESRKGDWQLLFQIASDENAGMMWSDAGTLCYFVRREDLKRRAFDKACLAFFTS